MRVEKEVRTAVYDAALQVEAYWFTGVMQRFPNHFHEHYVIGFIEKGSRYLCCGNREYTIEPGDLLLFNPRDSHACVQADNSSLDYRCLNIQPDVLQKAAYEITGRDERPRFSHNVVYKSELVAPLRELHQILLREQTDFQKEELLLFLLEQLLEEHAGQCDAGERESAQVRAIADYLAGNYEKPVTLEELGALTGLSKYTLLRRFTREKGISPYSYLCTLRIDQAKRLLQQGEPPMDAALQCGFSDQSHFSNVFKKLIGITPGQYRRIFLQKGSAVQNGKDQCHDR